jgi:hypothetical protein
MYVFNYADVKHRKNVLKASVFNSKNHEKDLKTDRIEIQVLFRKWK